MPKNGKMLRWRTEYLRDKDMEKRRDDGRGDGRQERPISGRMEGRRTTVAAERM